MSGYIGSVTPVSTSGVERKKVFAITTTTTELTGVVYTPNFVQVFHNGIRLVSTTDYTATNGTSITLLTAAENGDQVVVQSFATFSPADTVSASAGGTFAGDVTVSGAFTSLGIDDNATSTTITIDASENVGINDTNPFARLTVGAPNSGDNLTLGGFYANSGATGGNSSQLKIIAASDLMRLQTGSNDALSFETALTERLRIVASGNVGIGTVNPSSLMHVHGVSPFVTIKDSRNKTWVPAESLGGINFDSADVSNSITTQAKIEVVTDNTSSGTYAAMAFSTSTPSALTEAMRIDSSGSLLVNRTAAATNGSKLFVESDNFVMGVNGTNTSGEAIRFFSNGTTVGTVSYSGSATAYNTSSDYRLKENVTPIQGAADTVMAMQPCTYTAIADGVWYDGFLAHELQEVHPRAVTGTKDAMKDEEYEITPAVEATYAEDGTVLTEAVPAVTGTRSVPDMQSVDYSKLTPILTAALQEALTEIAALKVRVAALEVTP